MSRVDRATISEAVAGERAFARGAKAFRYGGRVLLVVGIGMSIARVASAPEGKRVKAAAEEAGGWAFSLGGAAVGPKAGAAAAQRWDGRQARGAVVAVVLGSLIGGAIGFFAGEKAVSGAFDPERSSPTNYQVSHRAPRGRGCLDARLTRRRLARSAEAALAAGASRA